MATFGEKLKAIRLSRDMSQEDLAKVLGTTKQSISRYETGINSPRIDTVADFSKKLGVELSLLINNKYSVGDVLNHNLDTTIPPIDPNLAIVYDAWDSMTDDDKKFIASIAKRIKKEELN
ncbi:MAG: helix-turn-helix transcriptional regulator [Clostridiaceae bacterium]|jgi:transcriptional regulator with XRE-family HTH domain|nr:helix-turn-helix transcriptional regulator [Clostridiaceae bacterium]